MTNGETAGKQESHEELLRHVERDFETTAQSVHLDYFVLKIVAPKDATQTTPHFLSRNC
jgi:hypothetical protein